MLWLFLATIAVIAGSALMASRLAIKETIDRLLAVGVISLAAQVLTLLIAGAGLKQLNRLTVLLIAVAWAGLGLLLSRKHAPRGYVSWQLFYRELRNSLNAISLIFEGNLFIKVVGIISFVSLAALGLGLIYLPPYAWDEIWYHLTPMAAWCKQEAITRLPEAVLWQGYDPDYVSPDQLALDFSIAYNWANVYPLNTELSALWTMVLTGSDLLADAAQVPYVLLGVLTTFGLSRVGGARQATSALAAMVFLLTPMILIHLQVAYVDAAFAAMVATSLYLLLKWQKHPQTNYALLLGLAIGLMMGIKSTGLAFAVVFSLAAIVYGTWQCRHRKMSYRELYLQAGLVFLALFALGGFWYLRTWWFYGNPIYPVKIELLGWSLPGMGSVSQLFMFHNTPPPYRERSIILNILTSWLELGDESYNYHSRTRGLGPAWAALALPAILPFFFYAWRQRSAPVLWMVGVTVILLVIQPAVWWPRYILYVVPVGLAAWAWVYDRLYPRLKTIVACLMVLHLVIATGLVLVETLDKLPMALHKTSACRTFGQLYFRDYAWVDTIPPSNIGHTPMAWIYPLYGGLRHQVHLIDAASLQSWRKAICCQELDFVVIKRGYSHYEHWAQTLSDLLHPFIEGEQINVYQVKSQTIPR